MPEIKTLLSRYFDEDDGGALATACDLARRYPVDITELLEWVQCYVAEEAAIRRATVRLRKALGLRLIPGPVCRSR